jgi:hypothetical protein
MRVSRVGLARLECGATEPWKPLAQAHSLRERSLRKAEHMRRLALLLMITAGLVLPAAASAAGPFPGKYTTKLASPAQFKGTWTLTFTKAGTYTVALKGAVLVNGKYTVSGSKITLGHEKGPASCGPAGTYSFKRTGASLKLTKVSDSAAKCAGRIMVLTHGLTAA